ncbi:hypothetical protein LTS01_025856, partial [Friedmanniomyces endolithicus]
GLGLGLGDREEVRGEVQSVPDRRDRLRECQEHNQRDRQRLQRPARHLCRERRHSLDTRRHDRRRAVPLPQGGGDGSRLHLLLRKSCRRDLSPSVRDRCEHDRRRAPEQKLWQLHRHRVNERPHRQYPATTVRSQCGEGWCA